MKKKPFFWRSLVFFFGFLMLVHTALPITARAEQDIPSMEEAAAVYFYHLSSGSVICSKDETAVLGAGPCGKVMAGLLFCRMLGNRLEETVYITDDMVEGLSGHRLELEGGDTLSVRELLFAALCGSYNDAYNVLACYLEGSVSAFVESMNTAAAELGAQNTRFTDISGVMNDRSVTTAYDMSLIARAAYENALYMTVCNTYEYSIPSHKDFKNRNKLLSDPTYYNKKCVGMCAGETSVGGNCVLTVAENGQESYLCVVLGVQQTDMQYTVANRIINWVYSTYSYVDVITPDTVVCTLPVTVSDLTHEVEVKTNESLTCFLPAHVDVKKEITYSIRLLHTSLEAPVTEGTPVGYAAVIWNGQTLGTVALYTAGSAERSGFVSSLKSIQAITQSRVFVAGLVFFLLAFGAWILTEYILLVRKRHKWDKYFSTKISPLPNAAYEQKKKHHL